MVVSWWGGKWSWGWWLIVVWCILLCLLWEGNVGSGVVFVEYFVEYSVVQGILSGSGLGQNGFDTHYIWCVYQKSWNSWNRRDIWVVVVGIIITSKSRYIYMLCKWYSVIQLVVPCPNHLVSLDSSLYIYIYIYIYT